MNLIYLLVSQTLILVNSLSITCEQADSFYFLPNSSYQLTCDSKLPPNSFIIGSDQNYPNIFYNSSDGTWETFLTKYSLSSYLNSTNTLLISVTNPETLYFSICSLNSSIIKPISLIKEQITPCASNCSGNGECINNSCSCQTPYFGEDCSMSYTKLKGEFNKDFKIQAYGMKFFEINTTNTVFVSETKRTVHIFLNSNNTMPSFFDFTDYSTPLTKYNSSNSSQFFSVFCPKLTPCSFTLYAKAYYDIKMQAGIVVLICILCVTAIIVTLIIIRQVRKFRAQKRQSEGLSSKEIEKFAPLTKYKENPNNETCSICLSSFQPNEDLREIKNCQHLYHPECLDEWLKLKPKCPNCNLNIIEVK